MEDLILSFQFLEIEANPEWLQGFINLAIVLERRILTGYLNFFQCVKSTFYNGFVAVQVYEKIFFLNKLSQLFVFCQKFIEEIFLHRFVFEQNNVNMTLKILRLTNIILR